jgi:hypothetical protein
MSSEALKEFGFARCFHCQRILLAGRLYRGRCRDAADCAAARMIANALGDTEFIRGIETGRRESDARRSAL